jgi:hypothetical protein
MALSNVYSGRGRRYLRITEQRFHIYSFENDVWKPYKSLSEIQWSGPKLWPFRTGTPVWSDDTSASPSWDSTSTPR